MQLLSLSSKLHSFENCTDFIKEFDIKESDLIITCEYIYEPFFGSMNLPAQVLFQEKYGHGEPDNEMVEKMHAAITRDYDRVIAIGGGTVLDIAKLFSLEQIMPLLDLFQGRFKPAKKCDLVLVPTTCGTGSEVTNVSIVGFPALNTKLRLAIDELYAQDAVLIVEMLSNLPYKVFAASSIDALTHAIESSLSPLATPVSMLFGTEAIKIIIGNYRKLRAEGMEILPEMMGSFLLASNYGGIAFGKAGCGAIHAMSYPFGGKYHVSHGESNYVLTTSVLKKYAQLTDQLKLECVDKYYHTVNTLAEALGCEADQVNESLDDLLGFILEKKPMSAFGTQADELDSYVDIVENYQQIIMSHNPVLLSRDDIMDIYKDAL